MLIRDLPRPVTAAKADWLPGTHWLGFTPTDGSTAAREQCRTTINRQMGNGYVLEYMTRSFGEPNPAFTNSPRVRLDREAHSAVAGKLVAVHKLRPSSRRLEEILGEAEFNELQDIWADGASRFRWSVAFPIIESYSVAGQPYANQVFDAEAMRGLFAHPSATLRPLDDRERSLIADLAIELRPTRNAWIGIADEVEMAERTAINGTIQKWIDQDLSASAMEGMTEEQKRKIRKRAAWLAQRFASQRTRDNQLTCDDCGFDPKPKTEGTVIRPRSLLDVHHKHPLDEGARVTTFADFQMLCPNCHRFAHALANATAQ
jgi:5-methylcytosine-specific restriction protein A